MKIVDPLDFLTTLSTSKEFENNCPWFLSEKQKQSE
jgi:hypothetical protein